MKSNCCGAPMRLNRSDAEVRAGRTYFNVCTQCGKPCDPLDVESVREVLTRMSNALKEPPK